MNPLDRRQLTALAEPGALADWRLALAYSALDEDGVLAALPGRLDELAETCRLDREALRAVLELPVAWQLIMVDQDGRYLYGPAALEPRESAALAQHGVWIRRWSALVGGRLRDRTATSPAAPPNPPLATGLALLEAASEPAIRPVVDACLAAVPEARTVLDLGGGHGGYALELRRRRLAVTLQDLPAVIDIARADGRLPAAGVELVAADAFIELAPGPFDLVLCGTMTNMFGPARVVELLRRTRPILASDGALAIVSYLRDRGPVGAAFGIQMLVATPEGDAHGEADYRAWLAETGYGHVEARGLQASALTVVVAHV